MRRPGTRRIRGWGALVALLLALSPGAALSQATAARGSPLPAHGADWLARWSPLVRVADLPRDLPGGPGFSDLLSLSAPRVGEFWTAGNPGALAREVTDQRADFRFSYTGASGDYARPLDPGGLGSGQFSTMGWTPVGRRGAAIGNAVFDRSGFRDSLFADVFFPYGSNPFLVADTIGDPVRRSAVRLEGALGWEFGRLGLGFAVGWEGQSNRTTESPVPRLDRTAAPGLTLGASYDLGSVRLGAFGRVQGVTEFILIRTVAQPSRIFQIEGYEEPIPLDLQAPPYQRRFERHSHALGVSASLRAVGADWTVHGRREATSEDQFTRVAEGDPPLDTWDADGWTVGAAGQWRLGAEARAWLLTVDGEFRTLTGEAFQASIGGILFTVDESRLVGSLDLRGRLGAGWLLGGRLGARRSDHDRRDRLVGAASDIRSTEVGGSLEIGRMLGARAGIAIGGRLSRYSPTGTIPDPTTLGPEYARYMGPGLALELTDATSWGALATIRWQPSEATGLWLRGEYGSLSPGTATLPLTPTGSRTGWGLTAGATIDQIWP